MNSLEISLKILLAKHSRLVAELCAITAIANRQLAQEAWRSDWETPIFELTTQLDKIEGEINEALDKIKKIESSLYPHTEPK